MPPHFAAQSFAYWTTRLHDVGSDAQPERGSSRTPTSTATPKDLADVVAPLRPGRPLPVESEPG